MSPEALLLQENAALKDALDAATRREGDLVKEVSELRATVRRLRRALSLLMQEED